jgi:hypothetical protein
MKDWEVRRLVGAKRRSRCRRKKLEGWEATPGAALGSEERASPLRTASLEAQQARRLESEKARKLGGLAAEKQARLVTPVKTGVQSVCRCFRELDSGFRRNDKYQDRPTLNCRKAIPSAALGSEERPSSTDLRREGKN